MPSELVTIRREEPGDVDQVRRVNERAFERPSEAALVDAIRHSPGAASLVALVDDRVAGHILFTAVRVEGVEASGSGVGLAPMAVLPEYQRRGIGSQLVRAGLDICRSRGYTFVVVVGHPEYYPRFGFAQGSTRRLECEFAVPPEAFMVLELQAGALEHARGVVRYRPEFSTV